MFLAPWFLLGLLGAAVPLVLHLRRSTKAKKIYFSTTRFFDEQFLRASRRTQIQDRLLMLLRIALVCLFALALSQPILRLPGLGALAGAAGGRRNVAIVIDDSASMSVATPQGTLLDQAKRTAQTVLDDLSASRGDRATLVLAGQRDGGARTLFEQPTSDLAAVRKAIEDVQPTQLATDLQMATHQAGAALGAFSGAPPAGAREVFVIGGLQASGFSGPKSLSAGQGVVVNLVAVRPPTAAGAENVSVDAVQYGSSRPTAGVPFTFRALVSNHSPQTRRVAVRLEIEGQTVSQKDIEIPPQRAGVARLLYRFTTPGWHRGRIAIAPADNESWSDALPDDNQRFFALEVRQGVRVLAVDGSPSAAPANDELFFIRLALSAGEAVQQVRLDTISPDALSPATLADHPLVLLANVARLSSDALEALEHYVDGGGNLLITLGDRVQPEAYNAWTGDNRLHGGLLPGRLLDLVTSPTAAPGGTAPAPGTSPGTGPGASGGNSDAGSIGIIAHGHPALAGFDDGSLGDLTAVHFSARYRLQAPADDVLLATPQGEPLLAEKRFGRGRVMVFASTIDRDWTNLPVQPVFVPLVFRLVGYLSQGALGDAGFVRTGQVVQLPASATQLEAMQVDLPDKSTAYPQRDAEGRLLFSQTDQAGIYAVRSAGGDDAGAQAPGGQGVRYLFAANIPAAESELDYLDQAAIAPLVADGVRWTFIAKPADVNDAARVARQGLGLWDQLLVLALFVALLEPYLANRWSRFKAMKQARSGGSGGWTPMNRETREEKISAPSKEDEREMVEQR